MAGRNKRTVTIPKLIGKTIIAVMIFLLFMMLFLYSLEEIRVRFKYGSGNKGHQLNYYDSMYYSREYGQLMSSMRVNDSYDDDYDKYWEICDGFSDYLLYIQYKRAAETDPAYEEIRDTQAQKVLENYSSCAFADNEKELSVFADDVRNGTENGIR